MGELAVEVPLPAVNRSQQQFSGNASGSPQVSCAQLCSRPCSLAGLCGSALCFAAAANLDIPDVAAGELDTNADTLRWRADVVFAIASGVAAVMSGVLTDNTDATDVVGRRKTLASALILTSATCAMAACAKSPWQLIATRGIAGAGSGAGLPVIFAIMTDFVPNSSRPCLFALLFGILGCGTVVCEVAATVAANALGWRSAYMLLALPAALLALVVHCLLFVPKRAAAEPAVLEQGELQAGASFQDKGSASFSLRQSGVAADAFGESRNSRPWLKEGMVHYSVCGSRDAYAQLLCTSTVALVYAQAAVSMLPLAGLSAGLEAKHGKEQVLSPLAATSFRLCFALGVPVGAVVGSAVTAGLASMRRALCLAGLATALSTVPAWYFLLHPSEQFNTIAPLALSCGALSSVGVPLLSTVLANCTTPETRGVAFGLVWFILVAGVISGPWLLDLMRRPFGDDVAVRVAVAGWVLTGIVQCGAHSTVESDESMTQDLVRMQITIH
eukprot:Hpha_TRINITY_DN15524_c1_g1::TRINITY_DN15524_c1_g1_i1::g.107884::m.107884